MPTPPAHSGLILHADDYGMSTEATNGILRGFREGLLTSTSLMANAPDAERALQLWKVLEVDRVAGLLSSSAFRKKLHDPDRPFDLGVHLNLTQGSPLTGNRFPAELLDPDGLFLGIFPLFLRLRRHGERFRAAILSELDHQLQVVLDHNFRPTHLNGHQYIEMVPAITDAVIELLKRYCIPTVRVAREPSLARSTLFRGEWLKWPLALIKRAFAERFLQRITAAEIAHPDFFFGTSHAGRIDLPLLRRFLAGVDVLRWVEVGLHPAEAVNPRSYLDHPEGWDDPLAELRARELGMLTSRELEDFLESSGWRLGRLG